MTDDPDQYDWLALVVFLVLSVVLIVGLIMVPPGWVR